MDQLILESSIVTLQVYLSILTLRSTDAAVHERVPRQNCVRHVSGHELHATLCRVHPPSPDMVGPLDTSDWTQPSIQMQTHCLFLSFIKKNAYQIQIHSPSYAPSSFSFTFPASKPNASIVTCRHLHHPAYVAHSPVFIFSNMLDCSPISLFFLMCSTSCIFLFILNFILKIFTFHMIYMVFYIEFILNSHQN